MSLFIDRSEPPTPTLYLQAKKGACKCEKFCKTKFYLTGATLMQNFGFAFACKQTRWGNLSIKKPLVLSGDFISFNFKQRPSSQESCDLKFALANCERLVANQKNKCKVNVFFNKKTEPKAQFFW